jgi:hypothetical protein
MVAVAVSVSTTNGVVHQKEVTAIATIYLQQMEIGIMLSPVFRVMMNSGVLLNFAHGSVCSFCELLSFHCAL